MSQLLLSYIPLNYGVLEKSYPISEKDRLTQYVQDTSENYQIKRIIWADNGGSISPVLEIPYAEEILNHMAEWSGNKISKWFKATWKITKPGYEFILAPNYEKSLRRAKLALAPVLCHYFQYKVEKSSIDVSEHIRTPMNIGFKEPNKDTVQWCKFPLTQM